MSDKKQSPVVMLGGLRGQINNDGNSITVSELITLLSDAVKILPEVADQKIEPCLNNTHRIEIKRDTRKVDINA